VSAGGVAASNKGRKRERRKRERMERDDRGGGWGIVGKTRRSNFIGFQVASRKGFTVVLSSTFSDQKIISAGYAWFVLSCGIIVVRACFFV
jgi:hypothetical protein